MITSSQPKSLIGKAVRTPDGDGIIRNIRIGRQGLWIAEVEFSKSTLSRSGRGERRTFIPADLELI